MEDINRLCVFSFHKKTGEDVVISFVEMKGEKMQISLKEQRSGSDSEYEEITTFTVNVDNMFYGSIAHNSYRNSYSVPVSQDNDTSTKQHLVFDFSFSSNKQNIVQLILTTRCAYRDPVILIDENIDMSKNDSVRELCMFLELYVIPNAEVSYHLRPEVE